MNPPKLRVEFRVLLASGLALTAGVAGAQNVVNTTQTITASQSGGSYLVGDVGTGNLTVTGAGVVVNASNTGGGTDAPYAGLALGVKNASGVGTLNLSGGAVLSATFNAQIGRVGTGTVNVSGAGSRLTVTNNGHYEIGSTANSTGTLNITSGGVVTTSIDDASANAGNASVFATGAGATATVLVDGAGSSFSQSNTGFGAVSLSDGGTSTVTFSNGGNFNTAQNLYFAGTPSSSFTSVTANGGGSTINIGAANLAAPTAGGTLTVGGTLTNAGSGTGTLNFNQTDAFAFSSNIVAGASGSGAISVNQLGTGTSTLSGNNTFTGTLTVSAGTLILSGNNTGRPANAVTTVNNGGTLQLQAVAGNTAGGVSTALSREATGGFPLSLKNGSTLQLRSDSSVTFAGGNGFGGLGGATVTFDVNRQTAAGTGQTLTFAPGGFGTQNDTFNVTGGNGYTLALGNDSSFGGTFTLNANGANAQIGSISSTIGVTVGGAANTLVTGTINNGTLTKSGAGTLTLGGTNSYTGATAVNAGTLIVNGSTASGSAVTVGTVAANSGTLGGTGTVGGAVTVSAGGTITGGTVGTVGTLNLASPLTINGTYVADILGTTGDQLNVSGSLTIANGSALTLQGTAPSPMTYVLAVYASLVGSGRFTANLPAGYSLNYKATELDLVVTVPEPATWAGGLLLAGVLGYSRRRWQQAGLA